MSLVDAVQEYVGVGFLVRERSYKNRYDRECRVISIDHQPSGLGCDISVDSVDEADIQKFLERSVSPATNALWRKAETRGVGRE